MKKINKIYQSIIRIFILKILYFKLKKYKFYKKKKIFLNFIVRYYKICKIEKPINI